MTHIISKFPPPAISEAQHKISETLSKHFEESKRTKRQKQSWYYATERFRDIKIALMNKLGKIKSTLRSQLTGELCKPITDHKSFVENRVSIEILVSTKWSMACHTRRTITRQQLCSSMRNWKRSIRKLFLPESRTGER